MSERSDGRPVEQSGAFMPSRPSKLRSALLVLRAHPMASLAAFLLLAEVAIAISAGQLPIASPLDNDLRSRFEGPSGDHWFGTDSVGRDQFARVLWGTRSTLWIAFLSTLCGVGAGTVIGIVSGYFGGWFDLIAQRFIDTLQAFPALIMGMLIVSIVGPGKSLPLPLVDVNAIVLPIALIFAPGVARVVRAAVLTLRNRDFILACHTIGATPARIMLRHMLPNVFSPILVVTSLLFGAAILVEASLGFLGLGVAPPNPSLGGILAQEGRNNLALHPHLTVIPALVICCTVLCVNLVGDTLRDILDPSLRGRL